MKSIAFYLAVLGMLPQTAVASESNQQIPVVGQLPDGSTIEEIIPTEIYSERLQTAILGIERSTLTALQTRAEESKPWMIRSVVVGLGVNVEVGVGPIIKFGALPRFRVGFSNAKEPSIP